MGSAFGNQTAYANPAAPIFDTAALIDPATSTLFLPPFLEPKHEGMVVEEDRTEVFVAMNEELMPEVQVNEYAHIFEANPSFEDLMVKTAALLPAESDDEEDLDDDDNNN